MMKLSIATLYILLLPCLAVRHGFVYQVFNNTAFGGRASIDSTADSLILPLDQVKPWQSLRIQASLMPETSEWFLLGLKASAGYARLWVDHHLLVDGWCNGTLLEGNYALPVPFLSDSSLLQLEFTFWDTTSSYVELTANHSTISPSWFYASVSIPELKYQRHRHNAEQGWNTWLSRDMLTFALLPHGLEVSLSLSVGNYTVANIGAPSCDPVAFPVKHGYHDTRGEYTELEEVRVGDTAKYKVESAASDRDSLAIVITSLADINDDATVSISVHVPDDYLPRYCQTELEQQGMIADCPGFQRIYVRGTQKGSLQSSQDNPSKLNLPQNKDTSITIVASTKSQESTLYAQDDPANIVATNRRRLLTRFGAPKHNETRAGLLTAISWNVIYTPYEGIITPVFRGSPWPATKPHNYVLFEWDTYFASIMATYADDPWVATNNIVRMTSSLFFQGFVPGFWNGLCGEMDKSKPPISGMALETLVKKYPNLQWVVELLLPNLLEWNRWWVRARMKLVTDGVGLIAPGSTRENVKLNFHCNEASALDAARCETGLDNSPLYDDAIFVDDGNVMNQVDVGMSALYAYDCAILGRLARLVGHTEAALELEAKAKKVRSILHELLWNDDEGIYLNKEWTTGNWIPREHNGSNYPIAPTNLYPLLIQAPSHKQTDSIIERYLLNSSEFSVNSDKPYGMPSISRSSRAFQDNSYWRGRSWGPMNFLVYMGLLQYSSPIVRRARRHLAAQSEATFNVEWKRYRRIMENYNSITAEGCDKMNSKPFYHWGALNALVALKEVEYAEETKVMYNVSVI